MTAIHLAHVAKQFGDTTALDDVTLDLAPGSFTALLGPSGCGKTTLLRLIAGFEAPSAGTIAFDDRVVADDRTVTPPEKRGVGVVFQSYALWPHMNVEANIAYPLKTRGVERGQVSTRVREVLDIVGLAGFEGRGVDELSGGQRQRVALARCIVAQTGIILFDEPLANLDMHLRATMVEVFRDIHRRTGATIVYVTHDQAEALALADRVAVMQAGRVLQFAPPEQVYHAPADAAVARFVGRGALLSAEVERADVAASVRVAGQVVAARGRPGLQKGPARLLLRPEGLSLAETGLPAIVRSTTYRGPVHEVRLALESGEEVVLDARTAPRVGDQVRVMVSDAWVLPEA